MMLEAHLRRTAEKFWESAGHIKSKCPRDIESAIAWSVPLFVVRIPKLSVHAVENYLRQRQLPAVIGAMDRPLHGCVIAMRGKGVVIVNGTDSPDEVRFTIAHEVSHFLLDYQQPRLMTIEKLGSGIEEVLDGRRPPRPEERIDALLANIQLGLYSHFMHRGNAGSVAGPVLEAESQADRLAFELIAPETAVWQELPKLFYSQPYNTRVLTLRRLLLRRFGMPIGAAREYAARLCRSRFGGVSVREWLG